MKIVNLIAVGLLVGGIGTASAQEPINLTETQMDNVTAAGTATATALAGAFGFINAFSLTSSATSVEVLEIIPIQAGQITVDLTTSASHSEAAAL